MSDRELLELAAKAAGIVVISWKTDGAIIATNGPCRPWNPLTDDGDALRLASKLRIGMEYSGNVVRAIFTSKYPRCCEELMSSRNDKQAARRAIVRAAAEIGEEMP